MEEEGGCFLTRDERRVGSGGTRGRFCLRGCGATEASERRERVDRPPLKAEEGPGGLSWEERAGGRMDGIAERPRPAKRTAFALEMVSAALNAHQGGRPLETR